jgi:rod shape-determining protein MreB
LVYVKGKGIVLREPSVVAIDKTTGKLLKAGTDAQKMLGRTPGNIVALRPLSEGVISDYEMTERMIKEFLRKVSGFRAFKPRIVICVPSGITEVEERAVIDAGLQAGARRVYLIEEPVAAAIGAGIDISKPMGHMIVDIGGGTTDVAVISLKGIVESTSIKIAGDQFDEAIIKYIRRKHNVLIGERSAEELKVNIGCVFPRPEEKVIEAKGRCLMTGLPRVFNVTSGDMIDALEEVSTRVIEAIHSVLERTPPELVADISTNGIVMTGGGSLVWGFDKLIEAKTGIETHVADEAISCVVYGTGKSLDMINDMQDGTMNLSRRRQMRS